MITRGENSVSAEGTYRLPRDGESVPALPAMAKFSVTAPKLETFGIAIGGRTLSGRVQATGQLELINDAYNGAVRIDGGDFKVGNFVAQKLTAKIDVAKNVAEIQDFALRINDTNQLSLRGNAGLVKPFAYDAALLVELKNLATFEPLLAAFKVKEPIRGALHIDWSGKGEIEPASHSGELSVDLSKGRYGEIDLREIKLEGIYGADFAESTALRIVSDQTSFDATLEFRDGKIKVRDINLQQAQIPVLTGYVILPFEPANAEQRIPLDKRIAANLNANKLDIDRLLSSLRIKSPVAGILTANLVAGGTLLQPLTHLKITGRSLKTKAAPKLAPADLDLVMHYSRKEVTLDATLKQPQIQPLTIKGRAPFDLEATVTNKRIDPEMPVDLTVRLPPSSLAVVAAFVPAVRRIDGSAGIDARVAGTVGKPVLSGEANIQINSARLAHESVPALGGFRANLALADDTLSFRTFRGEIGGGTFDLSGRVRLEKLTEPFFDLRLQSRDVLVRRDDTITVRVDTDLRVDGPLAAGTVSGNIFVVNSRFFREIDILPIGLPGRPKPKPKSAPSEGAPSFDTPPLRDWKFDITIKTRPDDPFRIRGNLANGGAAIDLKFGGTGLEPWLDGNIRVENFVASLPFSKLSVSRGFITFKPDAPFEPSLDLQAESTLRDYHISSYIYGKASDPQVSLTSEPPLPQQDIVSLLATGTTTAEMTGNSNVIAGRAAMLVFQQLYRKVFKKREPAEGDDLLERFDFDVGAVDNRTGRQEISAGFKLSEHVYLIGDLDVAGEFTGRVRYLLRFR